MPDSTVVITGATSGLGLHTARRLAQRGWHVVMGHRDAARGAAAAEDVRRRVPGARVEAMHIDLAALRSVSRAVELLRDGGAPRPPLRAIVANGAVQVVDGVRTSADGYELTFATNHLGHHHLVTSLLDHLGPAARVVVVSSGTHWGPERALGFPGPRWRDPVELADPRRADASATAGRVRYATSKLANLLFVRELARRSAGRRIAANAFDPGLMPGTALARDYAPAARAAYRLLAPAVAALVPGAGTARRSSATLADMVDSRRFEGVTGAYVAGRTLAESSPLSHSADEARLLWEASRALVERALAGAGPALDGAPTGA
ncbi:SDR family NAD(P)-dependent oxidoreductase [Isoptericola variabilis]|uniref:Short-chain dehydrogenase/reductase SDR n=1 Tax=Isoptericola variabilis (strain 225) TaxID=743718 RepID=F6FVY5_ISOV2|nr:SDR family NAD(P)-dependent oxidoreductase [Isoptericola variabilis]AEG44455.1 short-chain dehydrogenase/reductase SDR [Isoptericola variabilis 225]TWH28271.1 protochlorophyllide reductase [Isoptericola variabilis J7]